MQDSIQDDPWNRVEKEVELSVREKALRDLFVNEYLKDYNPLAAAQRSGFNYSFAQDYAVKFMQESYVQMRIKECEHTPDQDSEELDKRRIRKALFEQAFYRGADSSHSARVSALGKLAAIYGMDDANANTIPNFPLTLNVVGVSPTTTTSESDKKASSTTEDSQIPLKFLS